MDDADVSDDDVWRPRERAQHKRQPSWNIRGMYSGAGTLISLRNPPWPGQRGPEEMI